MPFKYFSDTLEGPIALESVRGLDFAEFEALFPGEKGINHGDAYTKAVGLDPQRPASWWDADAKRWRHNWLPATRVIEYKKQPSRHECDERCVNATGRVMKCECACGGKNHGTGGRFLAQAV